MTNPAGQEPGEGVPERMNDQGSKGRVLGQKKPRQRRAKRCPSCLLLTDQEIQVREERNELLLLQLRRIKMEEEAEREKIRTLLIGRRQSQQRLVEQTDQFISCLSIRPHPQEVQLPQRNPQAHVGQYPQTQTWQTGVQSRIKQQKRDATTPSLNQSASQSASQSPSQSQNHVQQILLYVQHIRSYVHCPHPDRNLRCVHRPANSMALLMIMLEQSSTNGEAKYTIPR
jgi:hypothetical protein